MFSSTFLQALNVPTEPDSADGFKGVRLSQEMSACTLSKQDSSLFFFGAAEGVRRGWNQNAGRSGGLGLQDLTNFSRNNTWCVTTELHCFKKTQINYS